MRKGLIPILFLYIGILSCSDDLPLGGNDFPFSSTIKSDSIPLTPISRFTFNDYIGNMGFMSVGRVVDPIEGDINIKGNFVPNLKPFVSADTITSDVSMRLALINTNQFGDTAKAMTFELYEITRQWRATELKKSDSVAIAQNPVATVTLAAGVDTLFIPLDTTKTDFVKKYALYYNSTNTNATDSLRKRLDNYRNNVFGFQLKATSEGVIRMYPSSGIILQIQDTQRDTTYSLTSSVYANQYHKTDTIPYPFADYMSLNSYNETLMQFNLTVKNLDSLSINGNTVPTKSLSKAEMIFYEDSSLVKSLRVPTFRNVGATSILVFEATENSISDELIKNAPRFSAIRSGSTFKINITSFVNQLITSGEDERSLQLYATLRGNDGFYANALLFGTNSSVFNPKIVLTYSETVTK